MLSTCFSVSTCCLFLVSHVSVFQTCAFLDLTDGETGTGDATHLEPTLQPNKWKHPHFVWFQSHAFFFESFLLAGLTPEQRIFSTTRVVAG
ncbi:hypothetical protein BT67DRAFT_128442 [Trichocladium antarcticum]|uniref:Secreted protein n=1 Tax=Trichocladium antarcticum TaxID=1450529 RepID=A0AAN6USC9_9PEZI|nr:hypothetical protein BT67DRAFT_128442 [Trichocladium antarcticum]